MRSTKFSVSIQDIPYAKEERIQRDIFSLESKRSSIFQKKEGDFMKSVKQVELEICYLQREIEIRRRRKLAHAEYVKKRFGNRTNNRNRSFNRDNRAKR